MGSALTVCPWNKRYVIAMMVFVYVHVICLMRILHAYLRLWCAKVNVNNIKQLKTFALNECSQSLSVFAGKTNPMSSVIYFSRHSHNRLQQKNTQSIWFSANNFLFCVWPWPIILLIHLFHNRKCSICSILVFFFTLYHPQAIGFDVSMFNAIVKAFSFSRFVTISFIRLLFLSLWLLVMLDWSLFNWFEMKKNLLIHSNQLQQKKRKKQINKYCIILIHFHCYQKKTSPYGLRISKKKQTTATEIHSLLLIHNTYS